MRRLRRHDIIDLLGNLVDKSLVTVSHRDGQARYTLLQTLVDYGRDRLHDAGEDDDARDRHLCWMVELATEAESGLRGPAQLAWVERVGRERDNIRAALAWAVEQGRAADAVTIVAGFGYAWYISGAFKEGLASITQALAVDGEVPADRLTDRSCLGRMDVATGRRRDTRSNRTRRASGSAGSVGFRSQLLCRRGVRLDTASIPWTHHRRRRLG